jgi:hypothetical protein
MVRDVRPERDGGRGRSEQRKRYRFLHNATGDSELTWRLEYYDHSDPRCSVDED